MLRGLESYRTPDRQTQKAIRRCECRAGTQVALPVLVNHLWLRGQRAGSSLHKVAYRGMFSPLLARFLIAGLTLSGPSDQSSVSFDSCFYRFRPRSPDFWHNLSFDRSSDLLPGNNTFGAIRRLTPVAVTLENTLEVGCRSDTLSLER